jgi:hypothetical protein
MKKLGGMTWRLTHSKSTDALGGVSNGQQVSAPMSREDRKTPRIRAMRMGPNEQGDFVACALSEEVLDYDGLQQHPCCAASAVLLRLDKILIGSDEGGL